MKPVEIITSYFGLLVRTQGPTGFPFEVLCLILVHLVLLKRVYCIGPVELLSRVT
jgi:hypothetical protein